MTTPQHLTRFLVIQTAFIGDAILATALLEELHVHFPDVQLDLLVRRGNEPLFAGHPFLGQLLVWDKKKPGPLGKYQSLWQLAGQIRQTRYALIINCQRFGATGLLTVLSGAGITIGFAKNPFSWLFSQRVPHRIGPGVHEVDRNANLIRSLPKPFQRSAVSVGQPKPRLYPSSADFEFIKPYQQTPYVCIAPTSVWFTKQFPEAKWVELIEKLPTTQATYLLGAPADEAACLRIIAQAGRSNAVSLAGKLSLLQSAGLMQGAVMNYVNDSAPMHLASAMNAPTTAIFCSTIPNFGFGPLSDNSRIWQTDEPLPCRPCGLHGKAACPLGHFRCGYGIVVE